MVSKDTVLVVGAGASMPYKFPSGSQLVELILNQTKLTAWGDGRLTPVPTAEIATALMARDFSPADIARFRQSLELSRVNSIDAFLERRSEFVSMGKVAIAAALCPFENQATLLNVERPDEDWYRLLVNQLLANLQAGAKRPLTIVTYNYDRSLDHYLFTSLKNALGLDASNMLMLMSNLRIIHVHGALGYLPWQTTDDRKVRSYGIANERREIADENIKIIHESTDDSDEYRQAQEALARAACVCFLGFGYHPVNVRRLLASGWHVRPNTPPQILGTSYLLTNAEKQMKSQAFESRIHFDEIHYDCCRFLREHINIIA
jgi:hypothetical protein